jgi:hypothetical protein
MYQLIRKIHLYCGLIILAYLMMYFVSGYVMVHRPWFLTAQPPVTTETVPFPATREQSPEKLAAQVQEHLKLVGRIQFAGGQPNNQPPGMVRFWISRPRASIRVEVPTGEQHVRVITQRWNWVATLIVIHKVQGYDGEMRFNLFSFFGDLTGVSMIVFALSGVYLWWKRTKNRLWGILCLTASCVYAAGMMLYFAYAP